MNADPDTTAVLPATDPGALDRLRRFGGDRLLNEMIRLFLVAAPERVQAARASRARNDASGVELALHSLKSSSAQMGALRMQRLSEEGEQRARDGSIAGLGELIDDLEGELVRVREWLVEARDGSAA